VKKLWRKGKDKTEAALERLDRLTKDEGLSTGAQTLGIVHGIADDMRVVMGGAPFFRAFLADICLNTFPSGGIGRNSGMCLAQIRYHPH
jgi:hypothetical protein